MKDNSKSITSKRLNNSFSISVAFFTNSILNISNFSVSMLNPAAIGCPPASKAKFGTDLISSMIFTPEIERADPFDTFSPIDTAIEGL